MFTKDDYEKINKRLIQITQQSVETIEITNDTPPTTDDLADTNKAYSLKAAILFIDIRKSTYLTENSHAKSMVKIYRAFMRMTVSCVRVCGGVTRQFLGDRIMGVFTDTTDDDGKVVELAVDKAVTCARSMQTCLDFSLNKLLKNNVNGKIISCGIGIDYGKVLLTKVGMYGVEKDESKENETDCVWVGNCTNRASKYSDIASGGEIFISEDVYNSLSPDLKLDDTWQKIARHKAGTIFKGYITEKYYLEFSNGLGQATVQNDDNSSEDAIIIAEVIIELDKVQQRLNSKEVELKLLEEKLKREHTRNENNANQTRIDKQRLKTQNELFLEVQESFYKTLAGYVEYSFCKTNYINKMGIGFWKKIIREIYSLGKKIGKTDRLISRGLDCKLIAIYDYYGMYDKAYDVMIIMAEDNGYWVNIEENTLKWASQHNIVWKLKDAIAKRMNDYTKSTNREDYQKRLDQIKRIVGY